MCLQTLPRIGASVLCLLLRLKSRQNSCIHEDSNSCDSCRCLQLCLAVQVREINAQPIWNTELSQECPEHKDETYTKSGLGTPALDHLEGTIVVRISLRELYMYAKLCCPERSQLGLEKILHIWTAVLPAGEADQQTQILQQA